MVIMLDPENSLHSSRDPYNYPNSFISSLGGFINPEHSARSDDDDRIELPVCSPAEWEEEDGRVEVTAPRSSTT